MCVQNTSHHRTGGGGETPVPTPLIRPRVIENKFDRDGAEVEKNNVENVRTAYERYLKLEKVRDIKKTSESDNLCTMFVLNVTL